MEHIEIANKLQKSISDETLSRAEILRIMTGGEGRDVHNRRVRFFGDEDQIPTKVRAGVAFRG